MNWAHRLITSTPGEHHISALVWVGNDFDENGLSFHRSAIQRLIPEASDEWKVSMPQRFYKRYLRNLHGRSILNYIGEHQVDVVHFHFATTAALFTDLIMATDARVVVSFYGFDYRHAILADASLRARYRTIFKKSDLILVEGEGGHGLLESLGAPVEKVKTLHLGIDPEEVIFRPAEKKQGRLDLIQAATFTPKKGQLATIEAVSRALPRCPELKLTLLGEIGDREYYEGCMNLIRAEGVEPAVKVRDFVPYTTWFDLLASYDVLIQPSRTADSGDCEGGFPVTLIDALAVGRPVISTTHCDIPEVVRDGEWGRLLEEDDVVGLADAIQEFYAMGNETYQSMAKKGRQHVEAEYNIKDSGLKLGRLYQKLHA